MPQDYAVYVRVSTDKDEQISSVENQIDICRNWLERNGFVWDESCVYKDEGISGTTFLDRAAIQLILEKAKRKEIKMAVFKSISRLARDLKDSLEIREVLLAHGVRIISVEEGYDSHRAGKNDMSFELWSLFAAQYSRTLSAGVSAALAAKVRRGEHIGKTPYGYDKVDGKLVINKDEAKFVRQMFDWYNQGWGYKRIAKELNALGVPPKLGRIWQITSVHRIIHNPLYCGDFVLNQYGTMKVGGRKKQIRNPREQWIIFRDHHPAIVSRETWEQANSKDTKNKRTKITPWNEFRGLAKCAICGSNMVIVRSWKQKKDGERTNWDYLKCSQYRRAAYDGCINHDPIRYEDFRGLVIGRLLEEGQSISLNFTSDFEKRRQEDLVVLRKQLQQLQNKKKGLLDLFLEQLIDKSEFEAKRNELDEAIRQCEDSIFLLENQVHTDTEIRSIMEAFRSLENQDQDLYLAFQALINEIIVHQDGTIDIDFTFRSRQEV
jgi:site-specific DNA recombinase